MKMPLALLAFASVTLCSVSGPAAAADAPAADPLTEKLPPERLEAKVLKVFAAQDGAAIFRAYLVKWKDQEVVVSDPLAKTNYKEGDIIPVFAMNHPFPQNKEPHRLLAFTVTR